MFEPKTYGRSRHLRRVFGYARPSDYAMAGGMATVSPVSFWVMERVSPSFVGRGGFAPVMRLATAVGLIGGLHVLYQRSCSMSARPSDPDYTAHPSHRTLLRIHREHSGGGNGYEGDGRQGEAG